ARERIDYVLDLIDEGIDELDLDDNESILVDRSDAAWAKDQQESNKLWRMRLEDAVIAMRLDGTADETIVERLQQRYNSQRKRLAQSTSEDVFQLYVNALTQVYDPHTTYFTPHSSENFRSDERRVATGSTTEYA